MYGDQANEALGYALSHVGDLNADGFDDLTFSALTERSQDVDDSTTWRGKVHVVYGNKR